MESGPNSPNFLFVNKNASSGTLTRSKKDEKFNILSHVQSRRRDKAGRKLELEPWAKYTSHIALRGTDSSPSENSATENATAEKEAAEKSIQWLSMRLSQIYPQRNATDPFDCTVVGNDAHIQPMLSYSFSYFSRATFLAEAFAPPLITRQRVQMRHNEIIMERLRRCVHDEMLMYATLAYGSSCMGWTLGTIQEGRPPEYFIDKALRAVRDRLSSPDRKIDMWLLMSIQALAVTEMWNGIPEMWSKTPLRHASVLKTIEHCREASRTHLRALVALINSIDGWKTINPYVLESTILGDKFLAIIDAKKPILPLAWMPKPLSHTEQERSQIQSGRLGRLGEAFIKLELSEDLAQTLQQVADYCRTASWIWNHRTVTSKDESWLYRRLQALIYRLLFLDELQGLENCIRLAALLFLQHVTSYQGVQIAAIIILQQFRDAFIHAEILDESYASEVVLWCLFTGGMTTLGSEERIWSIETIAGLPQFSSLELRGRSFEDLLTTYLFIEEKQRSQLCSLVDEVHMRRELTCKMDQDVR